VSTRTPRGTRSRVRTEQERHRHQDQKEEAAREKERVPIGVAEPEFEETLPGSVQSCTADLRLLQGVAKGTPEVCH